MLARRHDVLLMPSLSANDLDASLKKRGAGLARGLAAPRWLGDGQHPIQRDSIPVLLIG
jgi:hypothetical protein